MPQQKPDILIIGGGVIGLNLALAAKRRWPGQSVTIIEKEAACGLHASSRNSGVLHAGFYYTADSLKARFTRDGCKQLTDYCLEKGLRINRCGKLVIAQEESEIEGLHELKRRGDKNGVELQLITEQEAKEIEPRVKTCRYSLFSPTTATVDPKEVLQSLIKDCQVAGIDIQTGTAYLGRNSHGVITSQGKIAPGFVINAAGLYADKVAMDFGFSEQYRILPFKGVYLYGDSSEKLRTNIYPVPNLDNPFLGVHFTVTVDQKVKIGPTAIPAFWRENYGGWKNFNFKESLEIMGREAGLFLKNRFGFRHLALQELQKYYRPHLVKMASKMITDVKKENYTHWGQPGIRAQLLDLKKGKLEMDFKYEGDDRSFHVLNAVSPAFTCSMPLANYLIEKQPF